MVVRFQFWVAQRIIVSFKEVEGTGGRRAGGER